MPLVLKLTVAVVMAILFAGSACWILAALKVAAGQPLIPWTPRRPVPWALIDLLGVLLLYFLAFFILLTLRVVGWLPQATSEVDVTLADKGVLVWASIVMSLSLLVIALPLIALRAGAIVRDFGLVWRELVADLKLGLIGFVMLAPPVYAIQGVLVYFWQPSKHPLMEMFKASPDAGFFAVLFIAAAIVAPLSEELIFRVLLQGFLEKAFSFRGSSVELLLGGGEPPVPLATTEAGGMPLAPVIRADVPLLDPNPFTASAIVSEQPVGHLALDEARQGPLRGAPAWAPIGITAPALKPLPSARSTTTFVARSRVASSRAAATSYQPCTVRALTGGASMVTTRIPSSRSSLVIVMP